MKLPQMIRNVWIYRRLLGLVVPLGIMLYFVGANWADVEVVFPFVGTMKSRVGVVMLASAGLGAVATWLTMTLRRAIQEARGQGTARDEATTKQAVAPSTAGGQTSRPDSEGRASK